MSTETTALAERTAQDYRLPATVPPDRYEIRLTPDLEKFKFAGEETVHVVVREPSAEIVLNAAELEIQCASITTSTGKTLEAEIAIDTENERARLTFSEALTTGACRLYLRFTGTLNDKLHGFYRSTYKNEKGEQ